MSIPVPKQRNSFRLVVPVALLAGLLADGVRAQEFTAADSGWVPLFNGQNFDGLYSRNYGQDIMRPPHPVWQVEHHGTDTATIRVSATSGGVQGHLGTDNNTYKHYRVRVHYRFDFVNPNFNAGLTYHTDESVPRMNNNWPRSIESQMKQNETGSAFSIAQLAFTTRASGSGQGSSYNPNGNTVQACASGCNGRWYRGSPFISPIESGQTRWMKKEVIVRGADSAIHTINDTVVFRLWNMRVVDNSGDSIAAHDSGSIAIQSEGALIRYRHWEIMEMPASTPMSAHHLHRLFLDTPSGPVAPSPGSKYVIRWRSIGDLPGVTIEYREGTGDWQTIAESVPDTGAYHWTVPESASGEADLRITGAGYVWGDSTVGKPPVSLHSGAARARGALFRLRDGRLPLPEDFARAEIRDVSGRMVRILSAGEAATQAATQAEAKAYWDLTDAAGHKVRPGLYFLRVTGARGDVNGRVLVP